jgi:hypothetical protein
MLAKSIINPKKAHLPEIEMWENLKEPYIAEFFTLKLRQEKESIFLLEKFRTPLELHPLNLPYY